jgi:hypothetical protein
LELNLSANVRKLTKSKVNNFKQHKDEYRTIFDDAIRERIVKIDDFKKWSEKSKFVIEE